MSHIKEKIILFIVIFFSCFLIFFRLTRADFQTDGAFYSMWSVGYLDYLLSDKQTTPIQWFNTIPWWSKLSFHAHPPLVFAIQNIFFRVLGESDYIALLPFALAGVGSLILLYFIAKKLYNSHVAILSVFLLGISTFFTWGARINYLEGMVMFFILLAVFFILKSTDHPQYLLWSGIAMGLSFLSKYTSFFLLPFFVLYIFLKNKKFIVSKRFFVSLFLVIAIFSPVIFYNIMLWKTRGHFDVQFSQIIPSMFDAAKKDWPKLFTERQGIHPLQNFINIQSALGMGYSSMFFLTIFISLLYLLVKIMWKEKKHMPLALIIFSLALEFTFIPLNERYADIWSPFLALVLSIFIYETYQSVRESKLPLLQYGYISVIGIICAMEIFFNFNTNHFNSPIGQKEVFYSDLRVENLGFKNLEKRLQEIWKNDTLYTSRIKHVRGLKDTTITEKNLYRNNIYLYENGLNWFATTWYFEKYRLYHGIVLSSDVALERKINLSVNWFYFLREKGVKNFYFIKGIKKDVFDTAYINNKESKKLSNFLYNNFKEAFAKNVPGGIEKVYNDNGELVFEILHANLN